mgnify:CR=1 FL=1
MIRPHGFQLIETASITPFGWIIQGNGFGMHAPYEKKHVIPVCFAVSD